MLRSTTLRFFRVAAPAVGASGFGKRVSMEMVLDMHSADIARPLDESEGVSRRGERQFPETFVRLRRSDNISSTVDFASVIAEAKRARRNTEEHISKCAVSNICFGGADMSFSEETSSALASLSGRKTVVLESKACDSEDVLTDCLSSLSTLLGPRDRILVCYETPPEDNAQRRKSANEARLIAARSWGGISGPSVQEYIPDVVSEASAMTDFLFGNVIGFSRLEERPIELRNPNIFYWGHLPAFSDIMALQLPDESPNADEHDKASFYRANFERGIDPDVDDPTQINQSHYSELLESWPPPCKIKKYADRVTAKLKERVANGGTSDAIMRVVEHELMHHETLIYNNCEADPPLSLPDCFPEPIAPKFSVASPSKNSKDSFADISGGNVILGAGKPGRSHIFRWDNEFGRKEVRVEPFSVSRLPVTNEDFACFVADGGYETPALWGGEDSPSYQWIKAWQRKCPTPWVLRENGQLPEALRMPFDGRVPFSKGSRFPAMVTFFEADAYCRWLGGSCRVMSEAEYHRILDDDEGAEKAFSRAARNGNNDYKYRGFIDAGAMDDVVAGGVRDLVGNGWEITASKHGPFQGFEKDPFYPNYSFDFFDEAHHVFKGAGPFTSRMLLRSTFRNFYQVNYPYVMSKFRVVKC